MRERFLQACRRETVDATPVWLMRQAGRYMPEYRVLRARHEFIEMCMTPELAVEITLQPVRAFDLDAAILFSDLLVPLAPIGIHFHFVEGEGPIIDSPVRSRRDVEALRLIDPRESLAPVVEAVSLLKGELRVPLIGFAGAPFTLASYAVEGGRTRNFARVKALMYGDPATWHALAERLAVTAGDFLAAQIQAGAHAVQLFDTWIGALDVKDFREFALPHLQTIFARVKHSGVPRIYFGTDTAHLLDQLVEIGADVIGIDWRVPLDQAWRRLGYEHAVQGNLDPTLLLGPKERLVSRSDEILERAAGRNGHIFNLGHGVLPSTSPATVRTLIDHVHERSRR